MKHFFFLLPLLAVGATLPEFAEVPEAVRLERNPVVAVDPAGNYVVNGKTRLLLGVQAASSQVAADLAPTSGYGADWKWFYEEPLNYANAQRIGFDTLAIFTANDWIANIVPGFRDGAFDGSNREVGDVLRSNGLPTLVDFTCFPWTHGKLAEDKFRGVVPAEAVNANRDRANNHWVPYNIFHPEGRRLYREMWRSGVLEMKSGGNPLMLFELFNEPAYDDPSPYNRERFAAFLKEKYGSVEAMNRRWGGSYASFDAAAGFKTANELPGLYVDWAKFMESGFRELAGLGVDTIRELVPDARICFQIMGGSYYRVLPRSNVNLYEINGLLDAISTPTGGGIGVSGGYDAPPEHSGEAPAVSALITEGLVQRHFTRALADGKPIHNPEAYTGNNYGATLNRIWLDVARGVDAIYLFEWSKRAWDWQPAGSEEGGKLIAEKFPWMVLNPYAYPAADFRSIQDAKQEIFRFAEFFVPRDRGVPREVAVLLSFPTERMAGATGYTVKNEITTYAGALQFNFFPADVILEEQLPEKRAGRYRALVAAGVRNSYDTTAPALRNFVEEGGILIVGREFSVEDEYGRRSDCAGLFDGIEVAHNEQAGLTAIDFKIERPKLLPGKLVGRNDRRISAAPGWEVLAESDGAPVFLTRPLGKGAIYLITPEMQDYALGALISTALSRHDIRPALELTRVGKGDLAVNIEAHSARRDGLTLHYLYNYDNYPKLVELALDGAGAAAELSADRLLPVAAGRAQLLLPPRNRVIVGVGSRAALEAKFGSQKPVTFDELRKEADRIQAELAAAKAAKARQSFRYRVDPARTAALDIRDFCNRAFLDAVAGDGKGGWTDQGRENSLDGVPWGVQEFLGVPCELIRFDQNDNRTCIILANESVKGDLPREVTGITVNAKLRSLIFFHTTAWFAGGREVMSYRIHYASGKTLDVPVVCGTNIGDWWMGSINFAVKNLVAWRNRADRGFYGWRWVNPTPEDEIRSFDIVSANTPAVPIVLAVTAERYDGRPATEFDSVPIVQPVVAGFNGVAGVIDGETITVKSDAKTKAWAGFFLHSRDFSAFNCSADALKNAVLKFEINGGTDSFGNHKGGQLLQLNVLAADSDYRKNRTGTMFNLEKGMADPGIDADPESFQEVEIPLAKFSRAGELPKGANGFFFQFRGDVHSGVVIRNVRLEVPAAAPAGGPVAPETSSVSPAVSARPTMLVPNQRELYPVGKVQTVLRDGVISVTTSPESALWSGFVCHFGKLPITPEDWQNGQLQFDLDGGAVGGQALQITLLKSAGGKTSASSAQLALADYVPGGKIVAGTQPVAIALKRFLTEKSGREFSAIMVQFQSKAGIAPFRISNLRILSR